MNAKQRVLIIDLSTMSMKMKGQNPYETTRNLMRVEELLLFPPTFSDNQPRLKTNLDTLGVSINVFTDFDIETASDVLSLLFKMDEQVDMEIDGEKDNEGNLIPYTICIHFKHSEINSRLAKFAKAKKLQTNLIASKDAFPSEEAFQHEVEQMNETSEQIKQHLVDTNRVVRKRATEISVKVYPQNKPI